MLGCIPMCVFPGVGVWVCWLQCTCECVLVCMLVSLKVCFGMLQRTFCACCLHMSGFLSMCVSLVCYAAFSCVSLGAHCMSLSTFVCLSGRDTFVCDSYVCVCFHGVHLCRCALVSSGV